MTDYPEWNYPLFNQTAARLRALGHEVYNPAEYIWEGPLDEFPIRDAFAEYCHEICLWAEMVVTLPGWERSAGASVEVALAKRCGMGVISVDLFLETKDDQSDDKA